MNGSGRSRSLRVAHVTAVFPPYWSGTGNVAYFNALELARRGHDVHVFTAAHPDEHDRDTPEIEVHRLWTPFRIGNAPFTPGLLAAFRGFDLIHLHWPFMFGAELTWLAVHIQRIPYVMTYHLDLRAERRAVFGLYQRIWGPALAGGAKKVLAVTAAHLRSSQVYPVLSERWGDVSEVPNGVDINLFSPSVSGEAVRSRYNIPADARVIIFVGAMDRAHEYKGVPDLLRAFNALDRPDAWLLLVGGGDLLPQYERQAAQLATRAHIVFAGAVSYQKLPAYYAAADVCVLPSRQPESFGMVLIEAMACGKPVIASDSPGVRSVVSHDVDGWLSQAGDVAELADKMGLILDNPQKRREMGRHGRRKVETKYDWPTIAEHLETLYLSVLGAAVPAMGLR